MSFLLAFWLLSFAALIGIIVYAHGRSPVMISSEEMPADWRDFIAIELTRMVGHLSRLATHARPHGERVVFHGTALFQKGHDLFIEKIFGLLHVEKGNVTSFFLKRIAEHKESLRKKDQA